MSQQIPIPSSATKLEAPTPPQQAPASPTRTALTSWWRQFKQRNESDSSANSIVSSTSSGNRHHGHHGHHNHLFHGGSSHNNKDGANGPGLTPRPVMRHMSRSSGAVHSVKDRNLDNPAVNGRSPSDGDVSTVFGDEIMAKIPPDLRENPIFGAELKRSIKYANVAISLSDPSGEQFIYGYIPIVVAKCGVYLKKNATNVEGIFRLSGSARRIKELQVIFNTPPLFGHNLVWTGFNVHDAANVLRRYLNNLPEPIIPLQYYEKFRDPLREFPLIMTSIEKASAASHGLSQTFSNTAISSSNSVPNSGPTSVTNSTTNIVANNVLQSDSTLNQNADPLLLTSGSESSNSTAGSNTVTTNETSKELDDTLGGEVDEQVQSQVDQAVKRYQQLILSLPSLNRQLLMYILDLLSIFAARSEENRMPASNLAAIFQPSLLSHPQHDMSPEEYHLSKVAIEFLILHSNSFLSYVESIAIREHEEGKKDNKAGNNRRKNSESMDPKNKSNMDKELPSVPVHRRRHSRSLSSVQDRPSTMSVSAAPAASSNTHSKFPGKLHIPHVAIFPTSSGSGSGYESTTSGSPGETQDKSANSSTSNLFSTVKRSVSFKRRNSKNRAASDASNSSALDPLRTVSGSSRRTTETENDLADDETTAVSRLSPNSAIALGQQHRTPSDPELTFSIDEVVSLELDPSASTPTSKIPSTPSSPRFQSLNSVISAGHNEESTVPNDTRLTHGSPSDQERYADSPDVDVDANDEESAPHKVSRWRRSILAHVPNFGDDKHDDDLLTPPSLSGGERLSPSSSAGSSGSKRSSWFKLRNKDRNSQDYTN